MPRHLHSPYNFIVALQWSGYDRSAGMDSCSKRQCILQNQNWTGALLCFTAVRIGDGPRSGHDTLLTDSEGRACRMLEGTSSSKR